MSDQTNGSKLSVYVPEKNPSFLKDELQLKKLLKSLDKASKTAVDALLLIMETTNDDKLKAACAKDLLAFYIETSKAQNADKMQRMIAEIRLNRQQPNTLVPLGDDDKARKKPLVDFHNIQNIE